MDKELKDLLNKLTIDDEDIEQLIAICPGLEVVDWDKAGACIKIVVESGYPMSDISSLIYINPSFMLYEPRDLKIKIDALDGDIEELLKIDPFLI